MIEFVNDKLRRKNDGQDNVYDNVYDNGSGSEMSVVKVEEKDGSRDSVVRQTAIHTTARAPQQQQQQQLGGVGRPAVGPSQTGLMREMSSELETRLQSRAVPRAQQPSSAIKPLVPNNPASGRKPPAPPLPLGPKPSITSGIKFNERAEVMEVEKQKNETDDR